MCLGVVLRLSHESADSVLIWGSAKIQGAYKLSEDFAKPYFHKYWTEMQDVTTIWKKNVCSFIVTLNEFDVRPTCDTADVQAITPIPAKPSQACLVWHSRLRSWCAFAIPVVSLEVVGCKHCPWRNPTGRNHTLSGLVTGVARCRRCCLWPLHDQPIDLAGVHLGTPGPPYANVVGPGLVGKCTPVPHLEDIWNFVWNINLCPVKYSNWKLGGILSVQTQQTASFRGLILCEHESTGIFQNKFIGKVVLKYTFTYTLLINLLNAQLNPICNLLALLVARHIFHVSGLRVNGNTTGMPHMGS